ncbi:MAG: oxidoreductase-like domain-containing protein [Luteimonas sp.]|nr:oxidoreductase-like domain-containing protein [Luteimonas sp.]
MPLPSDCCESGCDRCVFDLHAEELAYYEQQLAQWRERNPGRDPEQVRRQGG